MGTYKGPEDRKLRSVSRSTQRRQERGRDNHRRICNYLVTKSEGSEQWTFEDHGKVEKAVRSSKMRGLDCKWDKNACGYQFRYGPVKNNSPDDIRSILEKYDVNSANLIIVRTGWGCVAPCPNYQHLQGKPYRPVPEPWSDEVPITAVERAVLDRLREVIESRIQAGKQQTLDTGKENQWGCG